MITAVHIPTWLFLATLAVAFWLGRKSRRPA
jgi:hypothetical protein